MGGQPRETSDQRDWNDQQPGDAPQSERALAGRHPMKRRPARRSEIRVESLENRQLLTDGIFARLTGAITPTQRVDVRPFTVSPDDFAFPAATGGPVLMTVTIVATGNRSLDPAAVRIVPTGGSPAPQILAQRQDNPASPNSRIGRSATATVALAPGSYELQVRADRNTSGPYAALFRLAGDVNGDFQVNQIDQNAYNQQLQRRAPQRPPANFDLNLDGRLTLADSKIAALNLFSSTRIRPVSFLTLGVAREFDPNGDGIVTDGRIVLTGVTQPGSTVRLDQGDDGVFDQTTIADASGRYGFTVDLPFGATNFRVETRDAFGQRFVSDLQVRRIPDLTPPTIQILSPAQNIQVSQNVTIVGRVSDNLTVASAIRVEAQINVGPFLTVPVEADGTFRLTTGLPLDGSADGLQIITFRAIDGSGNVSETAVYRFNLQTDSPTGQLVNPDLIYSARPTLEIRFSRPMAPAAFLPENYFLLVTAGIEAGRIVPIRNAVAGPQGDSVFLIPEPPLTAEFYQIIPTGLVTDLAGNRVRLIDALGNPLDGLPFRVDPIIPVLQTVDISNAVNPVQPSFDLTFSEAMGEGAFVTGGYVVTIEGGPNSGQVVPLREVINLNQFDRRTARLVFERPPADSSYRISLTRRVTDLAGNVIDVGQPRIVTLELRNPTASINVPPLLNEPVTSIQVRFSEPMSNFTFNAVNYQLRIVGGPNDGQAVPLASVARFDAQSLSIIPASPLLNQRYRLILGPGITDLAGKPLDPPTTFDFVPDTIRPRASLAISGTQTQSISSFDVLFSEPMADSAFERLQYELFVLEGPGQGLPAPIFSVTRISPQTARINLAAPLANGRFRLFLGLGVTDLAGNVAVSEGFLEFAVDSTRPTAALSVSGVSAGTLSFLDVTFSEPMGLTAFQPQSYTLTFLGGPAITGLTVVQLDPRTVRLIPPQPLTDGNFRLTLDANLTDRVGNALIGQRVFEFSVRAVAPTATVSPMNALPDGAVNAVAVTYSRAMNPAAFQASVYQLIGPDGRSLPIRQVERINGSTARVGFDPLAPGTYFLRIDGPVADSGGIALVEPRLFSFVAPTSPQQAPPPFALASTTGGVSTLIDSLDLLFSQPMRAAAFEPASYQLVRLETRPTVPPIVEELPIGVAAVERLSPTQARLIFTGTLPNGTYRLRASEAVVDLASPARPLVTRDFPFDVAVVGGADVIPPRVETILPVNPVISNGLVSFDLVFSEVVSLGAFDIANYRLQVRTGFDAQNRPIFQDLPIASIESVGGPGASVSVARVTPRVPLTNSDEYRLVIDASRVDPITGEVLEFRTPSRIRDLAGNPLEGERIRPLLVRPINPDDLVPPRATIDLPAIVVNDLRDIEVFYDEPMAGAAFTAAGYRLVRTDGQPLQPGLTVTVQFLDAARARVSFSEALVDGPYQLRIQPEVTDLAGNPVTAPTVFGFEVRRQAPTLANVLVGTQTVPDGGVATLASNTIDLRFNQRMGLSAFQSASYVLTRLDNGQTIPAVSVVQADGDATARLVFANALPNAPYELTLLPSVVNAVGAPVTTTSFRFTVNATGGSTSSPIATLSRPAPNRIELAYSVEMAATAFLVSSYTLTNALGNVVPIALATRFDAQTVRLVLPANLTPGNYTLAISPTVVDRNGQPVAVGSRLLTFTV